MNPEKDRPRQSHKNVRSIRDLDGEIARKIGTETKQNGKQTHKLRGRREPIKARLGG